jgi:hypothetical protein
MKELSEVLVDSLASSLASSLRGFLVGATMLSGVALAQVPDRVGRVAYLAGDVQFYSESAQAWLPAQLNAPVTSRNSVFTGTDGRVEIRFGSTAVALDVQTQLDVHVLDDASFKAAVTRGSVSMRVRQIDSDESYEVMAPGASYAVLQAGQIRIDATNSGSSVTVLTGLVNASVVGGSSVMVESGQALSAENGAFGRSSARSSALDSWAAQRDSVNHASQSARYVSPNMTGYEELDANGRWASDADYGNVWYPTTYVTPGWVPYRDGRWAYVAPWGWTWIDAAPWGFAPFHYGRWVLIGPRWAWMPGAYVRRPSYAPALVGFIGSSAGSGGAISISIGARPAVGWYPLPPWERYQPAYGHHDRHLHNTNNFKIATPPASAWRTVEYRRVSANQVQGATVVSREVFVDSRSVRGAALSVAAPVLVAPVKAAAPVSAPIRRAESVPPPVAGPESGDRRIWREQDKGRAERGRGNVEEGKVLAVPARAAETAPVLQQPVPAMTGSVPRIYRSETREGERQIQPAGVAPSVREAAPAQSSPPQGGKPVTIIAEPVQRQIQPAAPLVERPVETRSRHEGGGRDSVPTVTVQPAPQARQPVPQAVVAPVVRVEAPAARPEPRMEQRVESRAAPRVEPRIETRAEARPEPRPEPRQVQRSEPPQVHAPAPQPQQHSEQKRAPEQERHPQGGRDKDRDKDKEKGK